MDNHCFGQLLGKFTALLLVLIDNNHSAAAGDKSLGEIKNIVGIKEASGNLSYMCEILDTCGGLFDIYSGNDELTLPTLCLGGKGVISVCSNVVPCQMRELCDAFFEPLIIVLLFS